MANINSHKSQLAFLTGNSLKPGINVVIDSLGRLIPAHV